ncbi:uncharacterized protein AUP68_01917 [Ilyonectria robusta]
MSHVITSSRTRLATASLIQESHAAFLQGFVAREAENRAAKQQPKLSAEQYAAHRAQLSNVRFIKPTYSHGTEINVSGIFRKWKRYCEDLKVGDWEATIKNLKRQTTQDFFLYICENSKIKSWGTGEEYIRQFQQLHTTINGQYMDRNDAKELTCCYQLLCYTGARPAELVDGERKKPKDGLVEQLFGRKVVEAPPSTDNSENPEQQESAPDKDSQLLESLLSQETVGRGRPKALCYEDIMMMIVRHPATGRCIPAMAIKFIHHKGADNKPRPTIFYFSPTRKLIFCAVSTILSLALHDKAFDSPSLINATSIFDKEPPKFQQSTPLRWKKSMLKIPVFRRYRGTTLSGIEAMLYSKLNDDMGASNAANGDAPDAVRDQMMRHDPQFATFHHAYLNEITNFDIQNAFLEEEKESQLFRLFAHVSLTRDPQATADMVPEEVWANLALDPEIVELEEERARLKQGHYRIEGHPDEERIRQLTNEIRAQRDRQVVKEYCEHYFYNRPTWDIVRQARGEEEEEYIEPIINVSIPERAKLAGILCYQPDNLVKDDLVQRRIEVIDLMVSLCDKRETVKRDRIQHRVKICPPVKTELPQSNAEHGSGPFPLLMHGAQCPDCIGDERLSLAERSFTYCRPTVMNDHFDGEHLIRREQAEQCGEKIRCEHPKCRNLKFECLDAFRSRLQGSWCRLAIIGTN